MPAALLIISLVLNVVVLIAVLAGVVTRARWVAGACGERTPARDILASIYAAILLCSVALLGMLLILGSSAPLISAIVALLSVQVIYKLLTAVAVQQSLRNPVVLSNLGIAAVHTVTLVTVLVSGG